MTQYGTEFGRYFSRYFSIIKNSKAHGMCALLYLEDGRNVQIKTDFMQMVLHPTVEC